MTHDIASDGLCTIISVTGMTPPRSGCLGELRTSLGESFGLFAIAVMHQAEEARRANDRVLLDVRRSKLGHRYVKTITRLDQSRNPTPCLKCGTFAPLIAGRLEIGAHYSCPSCHLMMFLEPITRSYA